MNKTVVALASDHAGIDLKAELGTWLREHGYEPLDLGPENRDSVDYPDYADKMAECVKAGDASVGILVCGTGIGISIAANRHREIRAALCSNSTDARLTRQHNDANVLALGARTMGAEVALDCLRVFLETEFEGGRHQRRVDKMS